MTPSLKQRVTSQRGLTLIELMVTLAISAVILTGVINIYISSLSQSKLTGNLTAMQESGRFALDLMARDIRMAGFTGCLAYDNKSEDPDNRANGTVDSQSPFWAVYKRGAVLASQQAMRGIQGWEATNTGLGTLVSLTPSRTGTAGGGWTTSDNNVLTETYAEALTGSDVIRLWTAGETGLGITSIASTPNSVAVTLPAGHGLVAGNIIMVSTCEYRLLGQICNVSGQTLTISQGSSGTCNNDFSTRIGASQQFISVEKAGVAEGFSYRDSTYFIGKRDTSANTPPSLFRAVGSTAREMVEGVENMQILYGVDTTHGLLVNQYRQRSATKYVTADQVGVGGWDDVVSVRISVLMRSFEKNVSGTQTVNFNNVALSYSDGYLRQAYSTTISLRNRTVGQ